MKDAKGNAELHSQASVAELKSRLNNGEPALTIVDVRNNEQFRERRIMGAVNMPMDSLMSTAESSLEFKRDIYVYGASSEETSQAANMLRQAGFQRVAELRGGIQTWEEIGGASEGIATNENAPSKDNYNVFARLKKHAEQQAKEKSM